MSGISESASTTAGRFNPAAVGAREDSIGSSRSSPGRIVPTVQRRRPTGRVVAAGGDDVAPIASTRRERAPRISRGEDREPSPRRRASRGNPRRLEPVDRPDHRGSPVSPGRRSAGPSHARIADPIRIHHPMAGRGRGRRARVGIRSAAGAVAVAGAVRG
ncbi:MAG: hypothetical protein M3077_14350 [Candidatus Dormibacteraeota bacterium]|nr:hypothetical protein [Candidatus Dormibacteraeota bacterium]